MESLKVGIKSVSKVSDREMNSNVKITLALYLVEIQALPFSNVAFERATIFQTKLFLHHEVSVC